MISPHDLKEPPHSKIGRVISFEEDDEVINAAEEILMAIIGNIAEMV